LLICVRAYLCDGCSTRLADLRALRAFGTRGHILSRIDYLIPNRQLHSIAGPTCPRPCSRLAYVRSWLLGAFLAPGCVPGSWVRSWLLGAFLAPGCLPASWVRSWLLGAFLAPGCVLGSWVRSWLLGAFLAPGCVPGSWVRSWLLGAFLAPCDARCSVGGCNHDCHESKR